MLCNISVANSRSALSSVCEAAGTCCRTSWRQVQVTSRLPRRSKVPANRDAEARGLTPTITTRVELPYSQCARASKRHQPSHTKLSKSNQTRLIRLRIYIRSRLRNSNSIDISPLVLGLLKSMGYRTQAPSVVISMSCSLRTGNNSIQLLQHFFYRALLTPFPSPPTESSLAIRRNWQSESIMQPFR